MRYTFLVFLLVTGKISLAQKSTHHFKGQMVFKESHYHESITRNHSDTLHTYYRYEIGKTIDITQPIYISKSESEEIIYETITPLVVNDSIIYRYANSIDSLDFIDTKMFPLSFEDTIRAAYCYRTRNSDCPDDDKEIDTYRIQDTLIYFGNYQLDCYQFEQKRPLYKYNTSFIRRIALDKNTLVPIEVITYNYNVPERRFKLYPGQGKNLVTFRRKLVAIQD